MALFKCKMCGGNIVAVEGQSCGVCDSCGTQTTLPSAADERMENLFNRANHFRMAGEFDRAAAAYELILNEHARSAEAHWGALLSRFGVEYVEDPATRQRVPTFHRMQSAALLADDDYRSALEYAPDEASRALYEREGQRLSGLQRDMLTVSKAERPYDVFLCYKESDETGGRTKDSALAWDLYHQLTKEGFRTFFAPVTLEDKLGEQYEPYIFAALQSAKVMLAIGTKPEYFAAIWVRNEWSRFLALTKADSSKLLIPCYRDMNVYDLPDELSSLQCQDMGRIGFAQDLLHGIEKLTRGARVESVERTESNVNAQSERAKANAGVPGAASLLTRARLFLEDGDFDTAREYADKVLDIEPLNAGAYIVKLQATLKVRREEELANCKEDFSQNADYIKALRFADAEQKSVYEGYVKERENSGKYESATKLAKLGEYEIASKMFAELGDFRDAQAQFETFSAMDTQRKLEQTRIEKERRLERERAAEQHKAEITRAKASRVITQARAEEQEKKTRRKKRMLVLLAFALTAGALLIYLLLTQSK